VIALSRSGQLDVKTDPLASPTGFPFKVLQLDGTMSDDDVYAQRHRICDLGYLRHAYKTAEGTIGWRCGSEPLDAYQRKAGDLSDTCGRKCICNGLLANIGIGQYRKQAGPEKPLVTSGDEVRDVARFLPAPDAEGYSAEDVVAYLLSAVETDVVAAR
jgi:nitronate monooxygenase